MQNATTSNALVGKVAGALLLASATSPVMAESTNNGDWANWLQNKPGMLYKSKENPYLQEVLLEGRLQYQAAYMEGSGVTGGDFNETFEEYRRARLGAKIKFLNYFGAKYQVNLVEDERPSNGELDWQYQDIDEAYLSFDLGKALGENYFDELKLSYGRHKFLLGQEAHESSNKLLTIERSGLSNKVYGGNYGSNRTTGLVVEAKKDDWTYGAALFTSSVDGDDNEAFGSWSDSEIYWLNLGYKASDKLTLGADFAYNNADVDSGDDSVMNYEWASSLNAHYQDGKFGIIGDFILGDNGDDLGHSAAREGSFYGVVLMPYYWIVDKKLQGVVQLEHMASSKDEGVRANSRYATRSHGGSVNSGRGDSHQSVYAGLNYYLAGHNAKIQGGIEYQQMDTPAGDFDTLTYITGVRISF